MVLQLSISTKPAISKEAAFKITKFEVKDVIVDNATLGELFKTKVYSGNQWDQGLCKNANFKRMSAIILDADQNFTIAKAQELFKNVHYIIHTSTSHMANLTNKGGVQERFRIILPLDPAEYDKITTSNLASDVYLYLFEQYPWADASCKDAARKFFPFLNKVYSNLFELHINEGKSYFTIDLTQVASVPKISEPAKIIHTQQYIYLNNEFTLEDRRTKIRLRNIKNKTNVFCIFCDDLASTSRSAFVDFNSEGRAFLVCQHCKKTYWIAPEDERGELFYLGSTLMSVMTSSTDAICSAISREILNDMSSERRNMLLNRVAKYRSVPAGKFSVNYMVDAYADTINYELNVQNWELNIKKPPLPVIKKDNKYVDNWLASIFGEHANFIKNWLALFSYLNYVPLPSIILNGVRGAGKTTFGELLQDMFPDMGAFWKADNKENYTDFFQKKVLVIEENDETDKRTQYTNIKSVSGASTLTVNLKYGAKFTVRNNASIVILSNNARPLFVVSSEAPRDESTNQFFMLTLKTAPEKINSAIRWELRDRIGYYIRTELRHRYEQWKTTSMSQHRYGLPVPITEDLTFIYSSSRTSLDDESDDIYNILTEGRNTVDFMGNPLRSFGPYTHITFKELKEICQVFKFKQNPTTYKKWLQDHGKLTHLEIRSADERLGFEVLKKV
jgi:hypothetical protein